jgi:hypothetical protein
MEFCEINSIYSTNHFHCQFKPIMSKKIRNSVGPDLAVFTFYN